MQTFLVKYSCSFLYYMYHMCYDICKSCCYMYLLCSNKLDLNFDLNFQFVWMKIGIFAQNKKDQQPEISNKLSFIIL